MLVIAASLFLNMLEKWTDARIAERKPFGKPAMKKSKNTLNIKKKRINIFYKEKAFRTGHRNAFSCVLGTRNNLVVKVRYRLGSRNC